MDGWFKVVIHHAAKAETESHQGIESEWRCDHDKMSYFDVVAVLKEIGYPTFLSMWYMNDDKRMEVMDDHGALEMAKIGIENGRVDLYVNGEYVSDDAEIQSEQFEGVGEVQSGGNGGPVEMRQSEPFEQVARVQSSGPVDKPKKKTERGTEMHTHPSKDKTPKRLRMEFDDESVTSPLANEKEDRRCTIECKGRNTSIINLISSSHQETDHSMGCKGRDTSLVNLISSSHEDNDQTLKGEKQNCDQWNSFQIGRKKDDVADLQQRVANLESEFDSLKLSNENLEYIILNKLQKTGGTYDTPPSWLIPLQFNNPSSTPRKSGKTDINIAARIVKKLHEEKVLRGKEKIKEDDDEDYSPIAMGTKRKLFTSSRKNKSIVATSTPTGFYITPKTSKHTPSKVVGPFTRKWLKDLDYDQCDMASYIFGCSANERIEEKEIMISTEYCEGSRKLLQCLKPEKMIVGDIIDLAACMLTYKERKDVNIPRVWFLPTTFSQYVLQWNTTTYQMIKNYRDRFMGKADMISKIFLPVHDPDHLHWFLLVIDFVKKELIYLDSFQSPSAFPGRKRSIRKLALFVDDLLALPSFYVSEPREKPSTFDFSLVTPDGLGVQADYSNDCGVWVISWMMQMGGNGYKINVDDGTRLRIALDLTLHPYNNLNQVILLRALQHKKGLLKTKEAD